jgi:hypothetical protein
VKAARNAGVLLGANLCERSDKTQQFPMLGTVRVVHEESADINIRRPATRRYVRFVPYEHAFGLADQIPAIAIGAAVEFPALNGHAHPGAVLPSRSQRMWP